jgi:hypothetical protein
LLLPPDVTSLAVLALIRIDTRRLDPFARRHLCPDFRAEAGAAVSRVGPGDAGALPL